MTRSGRRSLPRPTTTTWPPRSFAACTATATSAVRLLAVPTTRVMAIVNQRLGGGSDSERSGHCGELRQRLRDRQDRRHVEHHRSYAMAARWNQCTGYRSGNPNVIYAGETVCRRGTGVGHVSRSTRSALWRAVRQVRSGDTLERHRRVLQGQHVQHPRVPFRQPGVHRSGRNPLLVRRPIMVDGVKETEHDGEKPQEETGEENNYLLPDEAYKVLKWLALDRVARFGRVRACGRSQHGTFRAFRPDRDHVERSGRAWLAL